VLRQARERNLLSDEHFTVDGTLLEAWASVKSYQRKDAKNGRSTDDLAMQRWTSTGEAVKPDACIEDGPDAKMARKRQGQGSEAGYNGNLWWRTATD